MLGSYQYDDEQLEVVVLGALLQNSDLFHKVSDIITPDTFAYSLCSELYSYMKELITEQGSFTVTQLRQKFKHKPGEHPFPDIADSYGLAGVVNLRNHAKSLVDLHQKRLLQRLCEDTLTELRDKKSADVSAGISAGVVKIISGGAVDNSKGIREAFEEIYNDVQSPEPAYKASTGITKLDATMSGGMQKGRVYAFLAPAKCGKTLLATTVSNHLCDAGNKHLFICAEMGSREITERMLGQRLGVKTSDFRYRKDTTFLQMVAKEVATVKSNLIFEDEPGIELDRLQMVVERHVHRSKIEGFILDYYQLVTGQERGQSQAQHLENVANWIHRVCKKHNIWCLLLVQANEEGKVLGSRGLDRACDQKYLIQRPTDETGDYQGSNVWLKMQLSRYTQLSNIGSESYPSLQIHENGTHLTEI